MSTGFTSNHRVHLIAGLVLLGFTAVAGRLVQLHVLDRDVLLAQIDRARREVVIEKARRGDIVDARGDVLATSRTEITLSVDPWAVGEFLEAEKNPARRERLASQESEKRATLARQLGLSVTEVEQIFTPTTREPRENDDPKSLMPDGKVKVRWVKLREGVDEALFAEINKAAPRGLVSDRSYVRVYPHNQLAAHVLGFVNKENVPAQGMERWADFYLRGVDGWRESEKDGKRNELAQFRVRNVPASNGWSVVLSLDSAVQHMAEQELETLASKFKPEKATIIITEARTGFVLAMANWPTFDLNRYNQPGEAGERALRNPAVADYLEPGSTFKIVAASGAINEGLVTAQTCFDCAQDKVLYKGALRSLPREDHTFAEPLSVAEIIAHSSNRGAAQLGMLLGEERLYGYVRAFGFGEQTGLPAIYPETPGLLANYTKWSGSDITRIPMGHSVAATPLQIHMAMGVIASGGELLRPQLVREVRDAAGETLYRFDTVSRRRVITPPTAQATARMLMGVASSEGTAPEAAIPNFQVAGKTGTTQKIIDGQYSSKHHIASFVGFFPASRPEVVISVIVDDGHPASGGVAYGKLVAAPSFKRLGEQLIQYLELKPVAASVPGLLVTQGGRP